MMDTIAITVGAVALEALVIFAMLWIVRPR